MKKQLQMDKVAKQKNLHNKYDKNRDIGDST